MAQCHDIRERTSESGPVTDLAASGPSDSPQPPATHPETRHPAPGKADVTPPKPDVRLPPAAQLITPPPFLRGHESRAAGGRATAPSKAGPPKSAMSRTREKPRSRFPLLATTLALAAGLGGAAGAIAIPAARSVSFGPALAAPPGAEPIAQAQAMQNLIAQLSTDVGALRTALEQSNKATSTQFNNVTERLDRAERAQVEPAVKLAKIAETLERLDRRAGPTVHAATQNEITGSVNMAPQPAPDTKAKPTIIEEYVLRRVFDGVALVEGRRGILEVEPGATLPGAGRVEDIKRQDGRWVVVTTKGLIIPAR